MKQRAFQFLGLTRGALAMCCALASAHPACMSEGGRESDTVEEIVYDDHVSQDRDRDGLLDSWEDANSASLGVTSQAANIILVPVLEPGLTRAEVQPTVDRVVTFFGNLPLSNINGTRGIRATVVWGNAITSIDGDVRARGMPAWTIGKAHGVLVVRGGGGQTAQSDWAVAGNDWKTVVHELGHQFGLEHEPLGTGIPSPLYASLMNYDYDHQFAGSSDNVQFSSGRLRDLSLDETNLSEVLPYPTTDLSFLAFPPYNFAMRSSGTSTLIDWDRDGVFGESSVRAEVNGGAALTPRDMRSVDKAFGATALASVGGVLATVYPTLPVAWRTYNGGGVSPSTPGGLKLHLGNEVRTPITLEASGVTGDPHTIEAFGKLYLTFPTSSGYILASYRIDSARLTATSLNRVLVSASASTRPVLVRSGTSPQRLYVFEWDASTRQVRYRTLSETLSVGIERVLNDGSPTSTTPLLSHSPVSAAWNSRENKLVMTMTNSARRLHMVDLLTSGDVLYGSTRRAVHETYTGTRDRATILYDDRPGSGTEGEFIFFSMYDRNPPDPAHMEMVRFRPSTGVWVTKQLFHNIWTNTRNAPSAALHGSDIATAWRWDEPKRDDLHNALYVSLRSSGITDSGMTDFDDITFISQRGLRSSLAMVAGGPQVFEHTGANCSGSSCPGWVKLDRNARTSVATAGNGTLFQLHDTGTVWRYTNTPCSGDTCVGWRVIGNHRDARDLVAGGSEVYMLAERGRVRRYRGTTCSGTVCPPWEEIDVDSGITSLIAGSATVYKLRNNGEILQYTGSGRAWRLLDTNWRTRAIVASGTRLYQLHHDGAIWRYTGTPCSGTSCLGWERLGVNPNTVSIVAGGASLYQRQNNGSIWRYTGSPCVGNVCGGWQRVDNNPLSSMIVATDSTLYQRHTNGLLWRYVGPACSGESCTGWRLVDNNPRSSAIFAGSSRLYQVHLPPF